MKTSLFTLLLGLLALTATGCNRSNAQGAAAADASELPWGETDIVAVAFVGYGSEDETAVLELTHNWDTASYDLGNAYGHIAIEVEDAYAACDAVRAKGGKVVREAGPMKHGNTVIAFVEDPDGYKIEFIQKHGRED